MLRNGDAFFGVVLLLLGMGGLTTGSMHWLTWLNFLAAVCAFYLAGYGRNRTGGLAGTVAMGATLLVASIVALLSGSTGWLSWGTFTLACLILVVGIAAAFSTFDNDIPPRLTRPRPTR
jgi:fumarate reductase subunit C